MATERWMNPAPVLARVRVAVCIFPPDAEAPVWILVRCIQPVDDHEHDDADNDMAHAESREEGGMELGKKYPC